MVQYSAKMLSDQIQSLKSSLAHRCSASPKLHHSITEAFFLTHQLTSCLSLVSDELKSPQLLSPPIERQLSASSVGVVHLKSNRAHSFTSISHHQLDVEDTPPLPRHRLRSRSSSQPLLQNIVAPSRETSAPPTDAVGEGKNYKHIVHIVLRKHNVCTQ